MVLVSFDPSDPGWMQCKSAWHGSICNQGGIIGAQIADFLFFCFGDLAYIVPIIIFYYIWIFYEKKISINIFQFCVTLIVTLIFFILFCVFVQLIINDVFYFSLGGIIGSVLYTVIGIDCNMMLYLKYIIFFIGIFIFVYFFYNLFLFYLKIIQKKIMHFLYMICVFFRKKNKQKYNFYSQAHYNARILPSVFLLQKNILFRNPVYNSAKINKEFNVMSNIPRKSLKQFKDFNNNHLNQIRVMSLIRNISNKNKSIMKYSLIHQSKFNISYVDNTFYSGKNKNINKYIEKMRNVNISSSSFLKKMNINPVLSKYKNSVDNNSISLQQGGALCFNKNTSQFNSVSKVKHSDITTSFQKRPYCSNYKHFSLPDVNLLIRYDKNNLLDHIKFEKISRLIEKKLFEYRIIANVAEIVSGPVITRVDLNLSAGIKSSQITNLSCDLARSLSVSSVRVLEIVPGTPYVGLEIPNEKREMVCLRDIIDSDKFQKINSPLTVVFGKDVTNQPIIEDLRCMPHLLVAGTTGSGKSVGINVMIVSILYKSTPEDVRFIMIDPKILELSVYTGIPHLLRDVITNTQDAESILQWCVEEMDRRYKLMSMVRVRNLEGYNNYINQLDFQKNNTNFIEELFNTQYNNNSICFSKKSKKLPYIIIIIDEFSDLMITTTKKVEELIIRLTQKARASGIHIILATQRPSVDVITGVIKANIPARIAFTVSSKIDSRTIIGKSGAESLLGMGDMLYLPPNSSIPIRIHGAHITDTEICSVVNFWKKTTNMFN